MSEQAKPTIADLIERLNNGEQFSIEPNGDILPKMATPQGPVRPLVRSLTEVLDEAAADEATRVCANCKRPLGEHVEVTWREPLNSRSVIGAPSEAPLALATLCPTAVYR